jgi:predicted ATPase
MTLAMTKLEANMQTGLRTAACLGLSFNYEILQKAKKEDDFEMEPFLDKCVEDGYIIGIDKGFAWTHDQVHQAAYELIPISQRESFHLLLGSRLLIKSSSSEQGELLFYVVDNMNRGMRLLDDRGQKYELAYLNLRAGERGEESTLAFSVQDLFIPQVYSCTCSSSRHISHFIFSLLFSIKILHYRSITS